VDKQDIPRELGLAAIKNSLDHTRANFEKNKELSDSLEQIREKCIKEIDGLLGSKSDEYFKFREKGKEIARSMQPLFSATPEGRKIRSQFQKTRIAEANEFINRLGINRNDIGAVLRKYQEESRSVIDKTRNKETLDDIDYVSPNNIESHQWVDLQPPYWWSYGDRDTGHSGDAHFPVEYVEHSENHLTGEISSLSQLNIYLSDDHSTCFTATTTAQLVRFQMPASGRLDAWAHVQCVNSSYYGFLADEFGWSDANSLQSSRIFMLLGLGPDYDYRTFSLLYYHRGDNEGEWSGNMAMPGEFRYCHFVSQFDFAAGDWVLLRVGIQDNQDSVVNDMRVGLETKNSWVLRHVYVSNIHS
jgi:hypothetical protein